MTFYDDLIADGRAGPEGMALVERGTQSAVVTLNDPDKLNVLSAPLVAQLRAALEKLAADPG